MRSQTRSFLCQRIVFIVFCIAIVTFFRSAPAFATTNKHINSASLEQMVGQMIMIGFRGTGEEYFQSTDKDAQQSSSNKTNQSDLESVLASVKKGNLGGIILFDYDVVLRKPERNIKSLDQIKKLSKLLQKDAPLPLFIAIDQEGGYVNRLKPPRLPIFLLPSAKDMGKQSPEQTKIWGKKTGALLKELGINVNFAPTVDVDINPKSPAIGKIKRSFSSDPLLVIQHGKAFAEGLAKHGIIPAYKHFPGHGSATTDTHHFVTDITKTWTEKELIPYLPENRPHVPMMVLLGHLSHKKLDPKHSAVLSKAIVTDLLRNKLKWDGVIVSDDMQMDALNKQYGRKEALYHAITAGVDLLIYGNNLKHEENLAEIIHKDIMDLIKEGKISKERIAQSYARIIELKKATKIIY